MRKHPIFAATAAMVFRCALACTYLAAQPPAQTTVRIVEETLPPLKTGALYHIRLHATGGAPPYHWQVRGDLPAGLNLSPDGDLSGRPAASGPLNTTIVVADAGHPPQTASRDFKGEVTAALAFDWLDAPKVHDNRIDGSLKVSNGTKEDTFDLTVVVEAVATDSNRATAIGYQHFKLKPGTNDVRIPFGETLPSGAYIVNADAVAEIPATKNILRQHLQTAQPLQITIGP